MFMKLIQQAGKGAGLDFEDACKISAGRADLFRLAASCCDHCENMPLAATTEMCPIHTKQKKVRFLQMFSPTFGPNLVSYANQRRCQTKHIVARTHQCEKPIGDEENRCLATKAKSFTAPAAAVPRVRGHICGGRWHLR